MFYGGTNTLQTSMASGLKNTVTRVFFVGCTSLGVVCDVINDLNTDVDARWAHAGLDFVGITLLVFGSSFAIVYYAT